MCVWAGVRYGITGDEPQPGRQVASVRYTGAKARATRTERATNQRVGGKVGEGGEHNQRIKGNRRTNKGRQARGRQR